MQILWRIASNATNYSKDKNVQRAITHTHKHINYKRSNIDDYHNVYLPGLKEKKEGKMTAFKHVYINKYLVALFYKL